MTRDEYRTLLALQARRHLLLRQLDQIAIERARLDVLSAALRAEADAIDERLMHAQEDAA